MSDYFSLALPTPTGSAAPTASTPVRTSCAPEPQTRTEDTQKSREPLLGLAIHLVETPQGDINQQQVEQRIRDMDMLAQELEMAMTQEHIPQSTLVKDEPHAATSVTSEPHPEPSQPLSNCDAPIEREKEVRTIAPAFSLLFGGPRSSSSSTCSSTSSPDLQPEICMITLPVNTILINRRIDATPTPTTARPLPPWFSVPPTYSPPSTASHSPSVTSPNLPHAPSTDELSSTIVMEEIDSTTNTPSMDEHQAAKLEEPSAVLPSITITHSNRPTSFTSSGDGRLQPSFACADLTELLDFEDGDVVILGDDDGSSDGVDTLYENARSLDCSGVDCQGRAQPLLSHVEVATSVSAPIASIATTSTRDTLLTLPSPSVELSPTGTVQKPTYPRTAPVSDQRPREKKRKAVDEPQPSMGSTSTSFVVNKAHKEFEAPHPHPHSSSSTPAAASTSAPPKRNFILKTSPPPKRRSPPATRAPRTPTSHSSTSPTSSKHSTAGQSHNSKRKRDDDEEEEGEIRGSGAPSGRPSTSAQDTRPPSKKPKTYCSLGATRTPTRTPTAPHTQTRPTPTLSGHLRSAADLAHKRWKERMQQQHGGRMRVVSTDLLAMRAKVRRPRATNVSR